MKVVDILGRTIVSLSGQSPGPHQHIVEAVRFHLTRFNARAQNKISSG